MTYFDHATAPSRRPLRSVQLISANDVLGTALLAALTALGWQVSAEARWQPAGGVGHKPPRHIVLVADRAGVLPAGPPGRPPAGTAYLAVGSRTALAELGRAVANGVHAAVDGDQPFTELAGQLHQLLSNPLSPVQAAQFARRLDVRTAAAGLFHRLTRRERQVLAALVHGSTAAQIAGREHLALPTVRSHIQSILAKLNSPSQLAAVALTHRVCDEYELVRELRKLHQF
ncbi:MAG TPA: LuxR C-terminal-related transcriptional regulator [Jatrophihabitans sp.]|jgi:DNA-binding CsgD family transcriptional regulator|uniref:helix-turn-helix transcriptional regulator n=1 Tax=Jatrophihabitans sp. TaxID=1932789 RepID=UPI002EECB3F5